MRDDAAGIIAAEELVEELLEEGIQVIIGETDAAYCLDFIDDGDSIIILDAAVSGRPWGTVWQLPMQSAFLKCSQNQFQHDADLLSILKTKNLQVTGLLICIEAADISQGWGLSSALLSKLTMICTEIKRIILKFRGDIEHA
jgi:hydrogenase maturation protease